MDKNTAEEIKHHFDVVAEQLRTELRTEISDVKRHSDVVAEQLRTELRTEISDVKRHSDILAEELRTEIRDVKRHSDVVAESLRGEIRLVAEGVAGLDQKFTQEFVTVREEIREQIGEVKSLIRVTYGDLDRRVQALERKPS